MRILNIYLLRNQIWLESIIVEAAKQDALAVERPEHYQLSGIGLQDDKFFIIDNMKDLHRAIKPEAFIETSAGSKIFHWVCSSMYLATQKLSTTASFLQMMSVLSMMIQFKRYDHVVLNAGKFMGATHPADLTPEQYLQTGRIITSSNELLTYLFSNALRFNSKWLPFQEVDGETKAQSISRFIDNFYQTHGATEWFSFYGTTMLSEILFPQTPSLFRKYNLYRQLNFAHQPAAHLTQLVSMTMCLLHAGKKDELLPELRKASENAVKILCESAAGKRAHDAAGYSNGHTEIQLLCSASFTYRGDGRLSILLANNWYYKMHYAPGSQNHAIMEAEFRQLATTLDLTFAEDTDFHRELIFTPQSTARLLQLGVHYTPDYMKQLLKWKRCAETWRHGFTNSLSDNHRILKTLPRELMELIWQKVIVSTPIAVQPEVQSNNQATAVQPEVHPKKQTVAQEDLAVLSSELWKRPQRNKSLLFFSPIPRVAEILRAEDAIRKPTLSPGLTFPQREGSILGGSY